MKTKSDSVRNIYQWVAVAGAFLVLSGCAKPNSPTSDSDENAVLASSGFYSGEDAPGTRNLRAGETGTIGGATSGGTTDSGTISTGGTGTISGGTSTGSTGTGSSTGTSMGTTGSTVTGGSAATGTGAVTTGTSAGTITTATGSAGSASAGGADSGTIGGGGTGVTGDNGTIGSGTGTGTSSGTSTGTGNSGSSASNSGSSSGTSSGSTGTGSSTSSGSTGSGTSSGSSTGSTGSSASNSGGADNGTIGQGGTSTGSDGGHLPSGGGTVSGGTTGTGTGSTASNSGSSSGSAPGTTSSGSGSSGDSTSTGGTTSHPGSSGGTASNGGSDNGSHGGGSATTGSGTSGSGTTTGGTASNGNGSGTGSSSTGSNPPAGGTASNGGNSGGTSGGTSNGGNPSGGTASNGGSSSGHPTTGGTTSGGTASNPGNSGSTGSSTGGSNNGSGACTASSGSMLGNMSAWFKTMVGVGSNNCTGEVDHGTTVTVGRACSQMRSGIPYPSFKFFEEAKHPIMAVEATMYDQEDCKSGSYLASVGYGANYSTADVWSNGRGRDAVTHFLLDTIDLKNVDLKKTSWQTALTIRLNQAMTSYKGNLRDVYVKLLICDDVNGNGKCSDKSGANILSIATPSFTLANIPKKIDIDVWANRRATLSRNELMCDTQISPLVLDLTGQGFKLSSPENGVYFDLGATGNPVATGWTTSSTVGFLVRDMNRNGYIDDGSELFGNATLLSSGKRALNGFEALKDLDSDHDGYFTPNDDAWKQVGIWIDKNQNGLSEPGEMYSLDQLGIQSINLNYVNIMEVDPSGNQTRERSTFRRLVKGKSVPLQIIDIWFQTLVAY